MDVMDAATPRGTPSTVHHAPASRQSIRGRTERARAPACAPRRKLAFLACHLTGSAPLNDVALLGVAHFSHVWPRSCSGGGKRGGGQQVEKSTVCAAGLICDYVQPRARAALQSTRTVRPEN